jgi:RNA polymerase sigma-70 factor (ECF subfamily)
MKAWFFKIVANTAKRLARRRPPRPPRDIENVKDLTDSRGDSDHHRDMAEQLQALERALANLPEELRAPLLVRVRLNASYADITRILNLPKSTVAFRIRAAYAKLRQWLKG